jgi:hypothetical protein
VQLGTETEFLIFEEDDSPLWTPGAPRLKGLAPKSALLALIQVIAEVEGVAVASGSEEVVITNGSRIYIDPPYLEHATAVQAAAGLDAALVTIAAEFAAERVIVEAIRELANRREIRLLIFKTLKAPEDISLEVSAGYHENYGLSRDHYFRLFHRSSHWPRPIVNRVLIPFLATRTLWAGAGWYEHRSNSFHASQRASYIDSVYSLSTVVHHPILHIKRGATGIDRLRVHITSGDPTRNWDSLGNRADLAAVHTSAFRLALTAGVLVFIAEGMLDSLDLRLRDPVAAFHGVSRSPMDYRIELLDGSFIDPVELQRTLHRAISDSI